MLKIKLKPNKLFEIKPAELARVDFIKSGNQFPNIFGDKQRIIAESGKFSNAEQITKSIENPVEQSYARHFLKTLISLIDKFSINEPENRYIYGINLESASIVRIYDYIIPKGPKQGEKIQKIEKIKIRDLQNILAKAVESIRKQDISYPDYEKEIKKIFPVVNPQFEKYFQNPEEMVMLILRKSMPDIDVEIAKYKTGTSIFNKKMYETAKKPMDALINTLGIVNELAGDNVILISRSPVDLIRMSDFPGIQSCHSPPRPKKDSSGNIIMRGKAKEMEGQYFDCAVQESKNNGAVAFLIPRKTIESRKDKLQDREFFKDIERPEVEGATPMQRIRLRRYLHKPTKIELLVPELEIYGSNPSDAFLEGVISWAKSVQDTEINKISGSSMNLTDFVLVGGSYSDTPTKEILENFLSLEINIDGQDYDETEDARVSEKLLISGNFIKEFVRISGITSMSEVSSIARNLSFNTVEEGDTLSHEIKQQIKGIFLDKKIVNQLKKQGSLITDLARKAIMKSIESNFDIKQLSFDIRTPIYNGLHNQLSFVAEIDCVLPKDGNFSNEDIQRVLETARLSRFFFKPKEKFEKEFEKYLKIETDNYFNIKEYRARAINYYLRG
jgi:hypothetical protein